MASERVRAPLIGRAAEVGHLAELVAAAAQGQGQMLLLAGEAGIGKTRLVDEALAVAIRMGMTTRCGRAEELDARRPFAAIAGCLGIDPDPSDETIARHLREDIAGPSDGSVARDDVEWQLRLVDAVVAMVEELCSAGPVAIALDDLQWADVRTLHVLDRLGQAVGELPLFLCGAFRPAPRPPELTRILRSHAARGGRTLAIGPLPAAEVKHLLSRLLGVTPGPRLVAQAAATGGNPFYVTELVAVGRASRSLTTTATTADVDTVAVPAALKLTVLLELSYLSGETQDLLRTASVLGSSFSVSDLSLVLGRTAVALAPSLTEALDAGVLCEVGSRLAFRHDLLREAVYEDLPSSLRKAMHLDVARTLAAADASPLRVAEHFVRGASPGDAVAREWLQRAADEAVVRAPTIAVELLERAFELFDPADPDRDAVLADWVLSLEALGRLADAEAMCAELLSRRQAPATEAKLRLVLARALVRRGRFDEGLAQASLAEEREGLSPRQRARLVSVASTLPLMGSLDLKAAEATARRGLEIGRERGDEVSQAGCAYTLALVAFLRGQFVEALDWAVKARATGDRAPGDRLSFGWQNAHQMALLVLGQARVALDRVEEADSALSTVRRTAGELGFRTLVVHSHALVISHGWMLGRWDDATAEFDAFAELCAEFDERSPMVEVAAGARALIALHRGEPVVAGTVLSTAGDLGAPHAGHLASLARALLIECSGDREAALGVLAAAWDRSVRPGLLFVCPHLAPDLVRLALASGDVDRATEACERISTLVAANPGAVTIRGIELRCRGLLEDEPELIVEAAVVLRDSPRPLERARACEDVANALALRGRVSDARPWFDEAVAAYRQLKAAWDVARVAARRRAVGLGGLSATSSVVQRRGRTP
ncbi:MAG: AAA family ATPase [Actinomycetota bacterium]|nr:AAA family ATPase [Actinomycetota bacterium]